MPDQIALKYLQDSDLTLFDVIHKRDLAWRRAGQIDRVSKQKAINLNAREFTDQLYPAIKAASATGLRRVPLDLTIYGPGTSVPHEIARKAIRSEGAKNWRLNGETIHEPEDQPGRYAKLASGDLALLRFEGEPHPQSVTMVLLSAAAGDGAVMRSMMAFMDDTGMVLVPPADFVGALEGAAVPEGHLAWRLVADEDSEAAVASAVEGDAEPLRKLRSRRSLAGGGVSLEQFLRARAAAEETGRRGEEIVSDWLGSLCDHLDWVSAKEPLAPFDMLAEGWMLGGGMTYLDVKATKGPFQKPFHLSTGEMAFAADLDRPYRIVRVYDLDGTPMARISQPIGGFAEAVLKSLEGALPGGVTSDGFVVRPESAGLDWSEPMVVTAP